MMDVWLGDVHKWRQTFMRVDNFVSWSSISLSDVIDRQYNTIKLLDKMWFKKEKNGEYFLKFLNKIISF